ncbi:MBOAT family protein [Planctomycetota bacterium]|nr:MBOAT family protein [Planctomycetota bacterium]
MVFSSYSFILLFLPIVLVGFAVTTKLPSRRLPFVWLILCSLLYCGYWRIDDLVPLAASVTFNFALGRLLTKNHLQNKHTKLLLVLGVAANLAMLGYFKYTGMLTETTNTLFGLTWTIPKIILPIAISFYTFQQIAYLFDASRGLTREHHFIDYCLFVTFFPQLIAGPIVHHKDILPQFHNRKLAITAPNLSIGLSFFIFGLSKKVLIADELSLLTTKAFTSDTTGISLATAWLGAIAYTLQIYFDFSGYSDMALGLARFFGIKLPLNFNSPYRATNIIDFWRRWHITLSSFLRDYLYIPLGGNRHGKARRYTNLFITMLLGGLWHGASWVFMLWGGLHGIYLVINHAFRKITKHDPTIEPKLPYLIFARSLTFIAVVVAWVFFRADNFAQATDFIHAMFALGNTSLTSHPYKNAQIILIIAALICVFVLPNVQTMMRHHRPHFGRKLQWDGNPALNRWKWRPDTFWTIVQALLLVACLLQISRGGEFIYYRF